MVQYHLPMVPTQSFFSLIFTSLRSISQLIPSSAIRSLTLPFCTDLPVSLLETYAIQKETPGRGSYTILATNICQMELNMLPAKSHLPGQNCRPSPSIGGSLGASQLSKPLRVQCSMYCFTRKMGFPTRMSISIRKSVSFNCPSLHLCCSDHAQLFIISPYHPLIEIDPEGEKISITLSH